jgi:hypothetical protein
MEIARNLTINLTFHGKQAITLSLRPANFAASQHMRRFRRLTDAALLETGIRHSNVANKLTLTAVRASSRGLRIPSDAPHSQRN